MRNYVRLAKRLINYCDTHNYTLQFYNCEECWAIATDSRGVLIRLHIDPRTYLVWRVRVYRG